MPCAARSKSRAAGRKVAFTASDSFVIDRHGDDFRTLIEDGLIDILFVNERELATLTGEDGFEAGLAALKDKVPTLVATRSADGAVAVQNGERAQVAAEPVDEVVDTTGAGDLFAAGFLTGLTRGETLETCLRMGAICAAEVISHTARGLKRTSRRWSPKNWAEVLPERCVRPQISVACSRL